MNIQIITDEIKHKLNHAMATKVNSYAKTIDDADEEKESKVSLFVTDLTFQVSNKVIKEKLSKINPKPIEFTFSLNRSKYFEQTINDLVSQINNEVYFDQKEIARQKNNVSKGEPFSISFKGYFLSDYGYIGSKKIHQTEEITNEWFPSILSCMRVKEEDPKEAEEMLVFLKEFVMFGFQKAINMEYVFIDSQKMDESLATVENVIIDGKSFTAEEFPQFREKNLLSRKKG